MDAIESFLSVITILPFFPFLFVYFIVLRYKKHKKTALLTAMDVTTVFLIFAVAALFNNTFHTGFGFYLILLLLLISIGLIGSAQNRLKGKIDYGRMFKVVWRMAFVMMGISYIVLMVFGLFSYIVDLV